MSSAENNRREMRIIPYGGTGGLVTGSCNVLQIRDSQIVVDCGLFQGRDEYLDRNGKPRNLNDTSEIFRNTSDILVTHVHMDHIGRGPVAFRYGFKPNIWVSEGTSKFMEAMLNDSVKIQKKAKKPEEIMYGEDEVYEFLRRTKIVEPFTETPIGNKNSRITFEMIPNGHMYGSDSILIRDRHRNGGKNILFTGDMGREHQFLSGGWVDLISEFPKDPIHVIVVESTSFDKEPVSITESVDGVGDAIKETFAKGGSVVIPALSQRGPAVIETVHKLGIDCKKYIDGPLLLNIYNTYKKDIDPNELTRNFGDIVDYYQSIEEAKARFDLKDVTVINSHQESIALSERLAQSGERAIVIAGGGMGVGRATNYIKGAFGQNPNNSIIFTCYQVPGTLGAELLDQKNNNVVIKSKIYHFRGFTSHVSGEEETFAYLERYNLDELETVVIGHGKDIARRPMAKVFEVRSNKYVGVITPRIGQIITA